MSKSKTSWAARAMLAGACGTLLLGGCAGSKHGGGGARAARGPAIVYVGWGDHSVFELDCHDPGGGCDALRAKAQAGGELVAGEGRFRLTGVRQDECGASGDTYPVVGYEIVAGGEEAYPGIAVYPADAAIDLVIVPQGQGPATAVEPALLGVIAGLATKDLATTDAPREVAAGELTVTQVVEGNFTGGAALDRIITAEIPLTGEDEGPGYVWSGAILVPDGDQGKATSFWFSTLETFRVDATYDLDGDGLRELVFSADYYEGSSRGSASLAKGTLDVGGAVGCGA